MKKNVLVGRISYINVAPVYYGLDNIKKPDWFHMITKPPSVLNQMMEECKIDISPVSAAAYADNYKDWLIIPDFSIGCDGNVLSVILVSRVPLNELNKKKVVFTNESATAAALLKLVFIQNGITPVIKTCKVHTPDDIPDDVDAALIIGDAALTYVWDKYFPCKYDLGAVWKAMTGLPFIFALWVVRKKFAEENQKIVSTVIDTFIASRKTGEQHIKEIIYSASQNIGIDIKLSEKYFNLLNCYLSPRQILGVETFFKGLYHNKIISEKVELNFF